jgi:NAD(P)H dehydrogenase (quinone)
MKVLTVVSHPRIESLTFTVADRFRQGLQEAGHQTEVLDLHRSGFNPILWEADEPNWSAEKQTFTPEVEAEMERMKKHDALAYIFPLWWYSMPAMLKGYIDRVWNNGFAYGSNSLQHNRVLWLILAGDSREHLAKRKYDQMIARHLNVGLASYVGIQNSRVEYFYETLKGDKEHTEKLLSQAYQHGLNFTKL